jgi:DNA recombination protein RmuC
LEHNPGLIEEGVDKGVILATPTTLISLLKAVAFGWRQEAMAENAQLISDLGTALYERIGTMAAHLDKLGAQIQRCATIFNQTVGSFEKRVLVTARRFHDLGVAKKGGAIPYIEPIEKNVQQITLTEPDLLDTWKSQK